MDTLPPELLRECLVRVPGLINRHACRLVCRTWHATLVALRAVPKEWFRHLVIGEICTRHRDNVTYGWDHGLDDLAGPEWLLMVPIDEARGVVGPTVRIRTWNFLDFGVTLRSDCLLDRCASRMLTGPLRPRGPHPHFHPPSVVLHYKKAVASITFPNLHFIAMTSCDAGFESQFTSHKVPNPSATQKTFVDLADYIHAILRAIVATADEEELILDKARRHLGFGPPDAWADWRTVLRQYDVHVMRQALSYPPFLERLDAVRAELAANKK